MCSGRFDFGVGRGSIRDEFDAFGIVMKESRKRVEEGVALVKQAWRLPKLEFARRFRPRMSGLPVLPPHLPEAAPGSRTAGLIQEKVTDIKLALTAEFC